MSKQVARRSFDENAFLANIKKRKRLALVIIGVMLPLLFYIFLKLLNQRHYILMSFMILLVVILPFFLVFEYRKPRARDVVLIASMTGFTVGASVVCSHTIPIHAGTALVVISGISLGPEAGFLVGALGRLLCNVFDGQGPWTPWQMVCWGLIGFLAGLAFNRTDIKAESLFEESTRRVRTSFQVIMGPVIAILVSELLGFTIFLVSQGGAKLSEYLGWWLYAFGALGLVTGCLFQRKKLTADLLTMVIFTFFVTFIVYGGIMNFASLIMSSGMGFDADGVTAKALRTVYLAGAPYDLAHAGGASLCIFFGESLIGKIQRVKIKYGIL